MADTGRRRSILDVVGSAARSLRLPRASLPIIQQPVRIQEKDDSFFENFSALHHKLDSAKKHILNSGKKQRRDGSLEVAFNYLANISEKELELLYLETMYTIRHKIGETDKRHDADPVGLVDFARKAFHLPQTTHDDLYAKASAQKPPVLVLNVVLIAAENLIAKDANGLSDPYCMMGIVTRKSIEEARSPVLSPTKARSIGHMLGGSIRRKTAGIHEGESIPAKFIRASSVQRETLNPIWNEKFQFDIEDKDGDKFHLDIWDHDDEENVVDAVRKLNEVASMKGLSRYFKQVAQSARTSNDDSVDDFLGCVTLNLQDIPSTGRDGWFELEGRTGKSKVSGRIHLRAWLGTREERPGQEADDNLADVTQHEALIRLFCEYELRNSKKEWLKWNGTLPKQAETILHQHSIQGDITPVQEAMCYWIALQKIHRHTPLDYKLLNRHLQDVLTNWAPTSLDKDEEDMLAASFSEFLAQAYDEILRHREVFPAWDHSGTESRLEELFRALAFLHSSALFKKTLPFQRDLSREIQSLIRKSAIAYYEKAKNSQQKEGKGEAIADMSRLLTHINAGVQSSYKIYQPPFLK